MENISNSYLLKTKPKFLSPTKIKLRLNLKQQINYIKNKTSAESKQNNSSLSAEELLLQRLIDIETKMIHIYLKPRQGF